MFHFNTDKFDFWPIYDAIKHFFPIGIRKDESKVYYSYPGLYELEKLIIDNIHDGKRYTENWVCFIKELENDFNAEIIGTTYGRAPSFSSFLLLDTSMTGNLTRTKELHFFVSLVGQFYTIIGQDISTVTLNENQIFRSTNYLIISPEYEYADAFRHLIMQIEHRFTGYRFVPYEICKQTIEGLEIRYSNKKLSTVFDALFNDQVDMTVSGTIGNAYFKSDQWIRDGYTGDSHGWTSFAG